MNNEDELKKKYPLAFEHIERQRPVRLPGDFLRAARKRKGLTLGEAMAAIGLNHPTSAQFLHRVEKGVQRLPFDHIEPLCRVYGCSDYVVRKLYCDQEIRKIRAKYGI